MPVWSRIVGKAAKQSDSLGVESGQGRDASPVAGTAPTNVEWRTVLTAAPTTTGEIGKLLAAAPRYGIEIRVPGH